MLEQLQIHIQNKISPKPHIVTKIKFKLNIGLNVNAEMLKFLEENVKENKSRHC